MRAAPRVPHWVRERAATALYLRQRSSGLPCDAIIARAQKDFAKGEFRFVAQALSHLVFAEPDNARGQW
jgi:alkyl sulfatase BDS1-like metallo-beta-lactamase superfamily hydrolase